MPETLKRTLTSRDLVLIVIGTVIGSGIFLVPGVALRQVSGRVDLALAVWTAAGVLSLLGALTYAELGAMRPSAGGLYVYIRDAFGRLPAFLYGWTLFFVISSGSLATLAVAFSIYLKELVPLTPAIERMMALAMIAVVAGVNVRGTRHSANLQNWTTGLKVRAILLMSGALLLWGRSGGPPAGPGLVSGSESLLTGFGLAMIGALWAYEGWQYCSFSVGEAIDPQRGFPRALCVGSGALIAIYLLANIAYVAALGPEAAAGADRIAAAATTAVFGPAAARLVAVAILVSIFSAANGLTLTSPRVYYAMAADGLFFQRLAGVHPRWGTPAVAVLAGSVWAAVLATTGTFEQLLTYVVFIGWIFYALGAISLFVYRRRAPDAVRPYRVPGYPWTPLVFVLTACALVLNTLVGQPGRAALGIGIVLLGAPAYWFWRTSRHRRP